MATTPAKVPGSPVISPPETFEEAMKNFGGLPTAKSVEQIAKENSLEGKSVPNLTKGT